MSWARAGYLGLLGLAIIVPVIYFLRARNLSHRVSAVFLWETLPLGHRTRLARFRFRLDWVLLAQLAGLMLLAVAAAGPALRVNQPVLSAMAIVIDGSASMKGTTADGRPKDEEARSRALEILGRYPGTPATVIQLSLSPAVLAPLGEDHDAVRSAIAGFTANWTGNGTAASLNTLLESQQPTERYEQIFVISDRIVSDLPSSASVQMVTISSAGNLSIDAFNVRQQPNGSGVVVFVGVRNDDSEYRETELRVSDGASRVRLPLVLAPGERQAFVLPFPAARGVAYTAELLPRDSAPFDDLRYYALPQNMPRAAAWLGEDDPFLRAAVQASGPVVWTETLEDAEFIVVNGVDALIDFGFESGSLPAGNLFIVSLSGRETAVALDGGAAAYASIRAVGAGDPILDGISPGALRVDLSSLLEDGEAGMIPEGGVRLLAASSQDVLLAGVTEAGRWVALVPDLWKTNLPLSVDFPLLVGNIVAYLAPDASTAVWTQREPGQAVDLDWAGPEARVVAPGGDSIRNSTRTDQPELQGTRGFDAGGVLLADVPGFYEILAPSGSILMAFNVAVSESEVGMDLESRETNPTARTESGSFALWPWLALVACVVLVGEAVAYHGAWPAGSRR